MNMVVFQDTIWNLDRGPWSVSEKLRWPPYPHSFHNFSSSLNAPLKPTKFFYQIILFPVLETSLRTHEYSGHTFLKQGGTLNCLRNTRHNKTLWNTPQTQNTLCMSWGQKAIVVFTNVVKAEDNLSFSSAVCNQKGTKCK